MEFKLGCELDYDVSSSSTFIFNICAVENEDQQIVDTNLQIQPDCTLEEYIVPHTENSYLRLVAPEGKLEISYQAIVNLKHSVDNPDEIAEILPSDIPLDIIHYLYPSRYCQSDAYG